MTHQYPQSRDIYAVPDYRQTQQVRATVRPGAVAVGDSIVAVTSTPAGLVTSNYRVTSLGREWTEKGEWIDEEDARSLGGSGQMLRIAARQVQYAYLVRE